MYGAVVKRAMRSFLCMRVDVVVEVVVTMFSLLSHLHFLCCGFLFFRAAEVMQGRKARRQRRSFFFVLVCLCLAVLCAGLVVFWVGRIRVGVG